MSTRSRPKVQSTSSACRRTYGNWGRAHICDRAEVHGIEGNVLGVELDFPVAEAADIFDVFLAFGDEFLLRTHLKFLADVVAELLEKLDFLQIFVLLGLDPLPLLAVLVIESLDEADEVFLDEVFLLAGGDVQARELLLYQDPVVAEEFDFVVEFGQLVQNAVFVLLVDFAQVDYRMPAVLGQGASTLPNMPQSEQIGSSHC